MAQHLIVIETILTTMISIGKVEYRIKDEFTVFYIAKIIFAIDMPIVFTVYNLIIYPIYKGVERLNHLW